MARPRTLTIDVLEIPILEAANYSETLERIGGFVLLRTVLGGAKRQCNWAKHRISLAGDGSIPSALLELDHTVQHTLKLACPQAIQGTTNVITIPAARRADVPLEGYAVMDIDGYLVETSVVSVVGDIVTLTAVTGAVAYRVNYWPEFEVFADPPSTNDNRRGAGSQWTMNCEEV